MTGQFAAKAVTTLKRAAVWDHAKDGIPSKNAAADRLVPQLINLTARLAIALLVTAGLAAGLCLHAGLSLGDPNMVRACECVFLWSLALIPSLR